MAKAREKKAKPAAYMSLVMALLLILAVLSAYASGLACITPKRYTVQEGVAVPETIRANRNMDDDTATEALRKSARDAVQPTYRIDGDAVDTLEAGAVSFFESLTDVRAKAQNLAQGHALEEADWDALLTEETVASLGNGMTPALDKAALEGILTAKESELTMLREIILPKLSTALSGGLAEAGVDKVRSAAIAEVNASTSLSAGLKRTGILALTAYLQPTYAVDEAATEAARTQAAAAVEPVQIKRGDIIVRQGAAVTSEQMALLREMDMVRGEGQDGPARVGLAIYVVLIYALFWVDLYTLQRQVYHDFKRILILALLLIAAPPLALVCNMVDLHISPMPLVAMLVAILVSERIGLAVSVLLSLLAAMLASQPGSPFGFDACAMLLFTLTAGMGATFALRRVQTRGAIIAAAAVGGALGSVCMIAAYLIENATLPVLLTDAAWALLSAVLSGLLVVGSLSIWENLFDIATPARLNELLNTSHPLLKQLMYEAPGTYQHSMNVAALAESAAERVGADPLLARVGGWYHDAGKLRRPLYFMENQQGENIHDTLPPEESAAIIISHQKDGAIILAKNKMPSAVIRIAAEHHGNSLVAYFYHKAQQMSGGEGVDSKKFRYPGNRPGTKEGAIVMLADCCEAAVRSLGECTKEAREEMVHKVLWSKLTEGSENLLSNAPLTFHELSEIERSFLRTFSGIMHDRIEYPEEKKP
ncbi:MAG: HDIG domain-containing protein [Candidatus Pelethousia sp.]|nr:HDIG domain-containing protein [Candidatus Pelethousia sp.]